MRLTIDDVDVSGRTPYDVKVTVGRDDIEGQPDAAVLSFQMVGYGAEKVGSVARLTDEYGPLFAGLLTDLKVEQDAAMTWTMSATATGSLAVLGQLSCGEGGWPQETDSQRINRILQEVGVPHNVAPLTDGPLLLAHPAGEVVNAADAARDAADSGMGVLWGDPNDPWMAISYIPASMRAWGVYPLTWRDLLDDDTWGAYTGVAWTRMVSPDVESDSPYPGHFTVDPSTANAEVVFEQIVGDLARTITVEYGEAPADGGDRPTVTAGDEHPEDNYSTLLVDVSDASNFATTMLRRRQQPAWRLTEIILHASLLDAEQWAQLRRDMAIGMRLTVPFPHGSPVGHEWQGYLEGWEHQATDEGHTLTLNVSDRQLTEPADRWMDITSSWADIPADLRWVYAVDMP